MSRDMRILRHGIVRGERNKMKAMILAAGLGTRLRPLTDEIPKPLLPVANRPQIGFLLELLRRAGVTGVIINLHHLADEIRAAVGNSYRDSLAVDYSLEPEILGTGGGLKKVEAFFGEEPFLLVNADALMDVDLRAAAEFHATSGAVATMVVRAREEGMAYGMVEMDREMRIRRILGRGGGTALTPVVFTGIHVLSKKVFGYIPPGVFSCINRDCYGAMLEAGERVAGYMVRGYWRDMGTVRSYFEANMDFLHGRMPAHCAGLAAADDVSSLAGAFPGAHFVPPVIMGRGCRVASASVIGPAAVLGDGCAVGRGCTLERVVALPGSSFADGETGRDCVRSKRSSIAVSAMS